MKRKKRVPLLNGISDKPSAEINGHNIKSKDNNAARNRAGFVFVKFSDYLLIKNIIGKEDADKDGLTNLEELDWGTNPYKADTDGDGMSDGEEIKLGRNPLGEGSVLKDLFIPHEGNDYQPHALHPKRLAFHAASAVVIKLALIGFIYLLPISAWLAPDVISAQGAKIIELTNQLRQRLGVNSLTENRLLDLAADRKAEDMVIKQYFAHTSPEGRGLAYWLKQTSYKYAVAGENLAMGFSEPQDIVDAWVKSPTHYKNLIDKDFKQIGVGMSAGTYLDTETTFVAQYFGAPRTDTVPAEPVKAPKVTMVAPAKPNQVLGSRETVKTVVKIIDEPLGIPAILEPKDSSITNQEEIKFIISHPGATAFDFLINGIVAASSSNLKSSSTYLSLDLPEGTQNAQVIAYAKNQTASSSILNLTIDRTPPALTIGSSQIKVIKSGSDYPVEVSVVLSPDTKSAQASVKGSVIPLYPDQNEANRWLGHGILSSDVLNARSVAPATIEAIDNSGNSAHFDLPWAELKPMPVSPMNQYMFVRQNTSPSVQALFDLTSGYYRLLLFVVFIALMLNIFIEIRRQHHHLIASAVGLMALLVVLLII